MSEPMNNQDCCSQSPISPDQSTRSPQMASDEIIHTTNDQDDADMIARDESIFGPTTPANNDETPIEMGDCEPSEVVDSPVVTNSPLFDDQPVEVDVHRAEPTVEIQYAPSPTNWDVAEDFQLLLSPEIQNVTVHLNIPHDIILLNEHETQAEPVHNEDDEIEVLFTETVPMQTVESPLQHVPINNDIHNVLDGPVVVIDLTQDENEAVRQASPTAVVSPIVIDLTQDDNQNKDLNQAQSTAVVSPVVIDLTQDGNEEEISQVQLVSNTGHSNNNEQINQSENDPPVVTVPVMQRTPPVAASSLEATDQHPIIAVAVDDPNRTIETSAHLHVPILSSRSSKRSSSSPGIRHINNIAGSVKRCRST